MEPNYKNEIELLKGLNKTAFNYYFESGLSEEEWESVREFYTWNEHMHTI